VGGGKAEILRACTASAETSGAIVYSVCCPAKRPLTDYTARIVPAYGIESQGGALVPLESAQILWQS
jgi:hypothetical protein